MSNLQLKNVDPDVHDAVRARAADAGQSVSEYLLELVRRDLRRPTRSAWLARLATREPVELPTEQVLAALDEQRGRR